jgi:hypothetical protein
MSILVLKLPMVQWQHCTPSSPTCILLILNRCGQQQQMTTTPSHNITCMPWQHRARRRAPRAGRTLLATCTAHHVVASTCRDNNRLADGMMRHGSPAPMDSQCTVHSGLCCRQQIFG